MPNPIVVIGTPGNVLPRQPLAPGQTCAGIFSMLTDGAARR